MTKNRAGNKRRQQQRAMSFKEAMKRNKIVQMKRHQSTLVKVTLMFKEAVEVEKSFGKYFYCLSIILFILSFTTLVEFTFLWSLVPILASMTLSILIVIAVKFYLKVRVKA